VASREYQDLPKCPSEPGDPLVGRRPVYFESATEAVDCPIYQRERMQAGTRVTGPAIIQEYASTTVLFAGDQAEVAATGDIVIQMRA